MARPEAAANPAGLEGIQLHLGWRPNLMASTWLPTPVAERPAASILPQTYRVTINNYLATGGDGFAALKDGTAPRVGPYDSRRVVWLFPGQKPDRTRPGRSGPRINCV